MRICDLNAEGGIYGQPQNRVKYNPFKILKFLHGLHKRPRPPAKWSAITTGGGGPPNDTGHVPDGEDEGDYLDDHVVVEVEVAHRDCHA